MAIAFLLAVFVSFIATFFSTPIFIRFLRRAGVVGTDVHKQNKPLIPTSAGIPVAVGVIIALMGYIFAKTFIYNNTSEVTLIFAAITAILLITFIGFLEDVLHNRTRDREGDNRSTTGGLKKWQKPLMTLPAAIPFMVIAAGTTTLALPFIGNINFGILYPLLLIPLGVVGAANMVNLLGGLNGIEAGMGIVYTGMLGLYAWTAGANLAALIAFATFGALIGVFYFNRYPARILPGDSIQYLLGAVLVSIAVLGNIEKAVVIAALPFFIEFILKLRGKLQKKTIGFLNKNGKVQSKYEKIYSLPHIWMRSGKWTEKQIVIFMMLIELGFASLIWFI